VPCGAHKSLKTCVERQVQIYKTDVRIRLRGAIMGVGWGVEVEMEVDGEDRK
jgi:hypothetical protein